MAATAKKKEAGSAKTRVSYKDIMIAYLFEGLVAIERGLKSKVYSADGVKKAVTALKAEKKADDLLLQFMQRHFGNKPGAKGRAAPHAGMERLYAPQKTKNRSWFIVIPVTGIGVKKKSDKIRVNFAENRLTATFVEK